MATLPPQAALKFANHDEEIMYHRMVVHARIAQGNTGPIVPYFVREDGTVDVYKMRELPMFEGMDK